MLPAPAQRFTTTVALSTLSLCFGCTDADLYVDMQEENDKAVQSSTGRLCAPDAIVEEVPYKVLFVVDTSFSNSWTDPTPSGGKPRRERAVRSAINAHLANDNVYFGIITFSDEPRAQTFGFTRDLDILNGAAANIANAQGGTNYSDTLWAAIEFILRDLDHVTEAEAARTTYLVFWLSDGFPTVAATDPASILPGVHYLRQALSGKVAGFHFNTAFLGGPSSSDPQVIAETAKAQQLLQDMAGAGDGRFIDILAGQEFNFDIDPLPVVRRFELVLFMANNLHSRLGATGPEPDSDSDGLLDEHEKILGTDMLNFDSDDDGLRDGIEWLLMPLLDPRRHDPACDTPGFDNDGDGLYDCEEQALGTNPAHQDTDGDFILDGVEVMLGGSPLVPDPGEDSDYDGMTNAMETMVHLPARVRTSTEEAEAWAYNYAVTQAASAEPGAPRCYDVRVNNITVVETKQTAFAPRGTNMIEFLAAFRPDDGGAPVRFMRATTTSRFVAPDVQDPPSGVINLSPTAFTVMPELGEP